MTEKIYGLTEKRRGLYEVPIEYTKRGKMIVYADSYEEAIQNALDPMSGSLPVDDEVVMGSQHIPFEKENAPFHIRFKEPPKWL